MKRTIGILAVAVAVALAVPAAGHAAAGACPVGTETWTQVGHETFVPRGLIRSQGVTSDGRSWFFSWQGSVERTDDHYIERAINTIPPSLIQPTFNADGTNHFGPTHIGDIDVSGGTVYAPEEDGSQGIGPINLNNPEYQRPYIVKYDAKTLLFKKSYLLPKALQEAGVPWVAVNGPAGEVYTDEWGMPHDRINVYDLQLSFVRFIDLHYGPELGAGFHLSRIQGAKVLGGALYATRDDARKSVFKIDLATGDVTKVFSIDPAGPTELEGLAIRPTKDGALMHILIVTHNAIGPTGVQMLHYAVGCSA